MKEQEDKTKKEQENKTKKEQGNKTKKEQENKTKKEHENKTKKEQENKIKKEQENKTINGYIQEFRNAPKLKRVAIVTAILGVFIGIIGIVISYYKKPIIQVVEQSTNKEITNHRNYDCSFDTSTNRIKVLIIKFNEHSSQGKSPAGERIFSRLKELNKTDSLNLSIKYCETQIGDNFNEDSAYFSLNMNNADIIIYGKYTVDNVNNKDNEIILNFISSGKFPIEDSLRKYTNCNDYRKASLSELSKGANQERIDYLIYSVVAYTELLKYKFDKAISRYNYIRNNYSIRSSNNDLYTAFSFYSLNKYRECIKYCREILKTDINNANLLAFIASSFNSLGNYIEALTNVNKAINIEPNEPLHYFNRGITYLNMKENQNAINDFSTAIKYDSSFIDAINMRSVAYQNIGDYLSSLEDISKCITLKPNDFISHNNKGAILMNLNRYEEAIFQLNKSISLNPNYALTYFNLGQAYQKLKKFDKAIENYKRVVELDKNNGRAFFELGRSISSVGNNNEAIYYYTQSLKCKNDNSSLLGLDSTDVLIGIADAYVRLNNLEKADYYLKTAIHINPKNNHIYIVKGMINYKNKKFKEACNEFIKAKSLGAEDADYYIKWYCE